MKVSLNLLMQFAEFKAPAGDIIDTISSRIGEVESVAELGPIYEGVVVGLVVESKPHPNADKLSVNRIDIGSKKVQVVAGDKSLQAGDRVAYIPPGNIVPATWGKDELKIAVRDIRGETSQGMLASEFELGFAPTHIGVLKLDSTAKSGTSLSDLYQLNDHIIEVETKVLTHRPDAFGHIGFARELAGALGQPFKSPAWYLNYKPLWPKSTGGLNLTVTNKLKDDVPRYSAAAYSGVIIQPSPVQIQSWLMRLGIRPLNNVVDLTNYLMVLSAQPLHAFDYDKVANNGTASIEIRRPKPGEQLKLIDGRTLKLHANAIVIANDRGPIGLGGIMGGADTEVDEHTKNVIIEAANFDMYSIRNTAMLHGINSEAVTRFARGQDANLPAAVQAYAIDFMKNWAGAKNASALVDDYTLPSRRPTLKANWQDINKLLGTQEAAKLMARTLNNVELKTTVKGSTLEVEVPTWRPDLSISADIAEEVGRLNGYSRIKAEIPKRSIKPVELSPLQTLTRNSRRILSSAGASEVMGYSGVPEPMLTNAGQDSTRAYRIRNAISPDVQLMRLSLIPSLLDKVNPNLRRGYDQFALFELGVTHHRSLIEDRLPQEQASLALIYAASIKVQSGKSGSAFFRARKYLIHLLEASGISYELKTSSPSGDPWLAQVSTPFAPTRRIFVYGEGKAVGVLGEFTPQLIRSARLPQSAAGFELQLHRLSSAPKPLKYEPLSKYPPVSVDLTLRTPAEAPYAKLAAVLDSIKLEDVELNIRPLDIFSPSPGHKHSSFRLEFVNPKRTMTQKEVNELLSGIVKKLQRRTGAVQI